jgi:hypothetical protein
MKIGSDELGQLAVEHCFFGGRKFHISILMPKIKGDQSKLAMPSTMGKVGHLKHASSRF